MSGLDLGLQLLIWRKAPVEQRNLRVMHTLPYEGS